MAENKEIDVIKSFSGETSYSELRFTAGKLLGTYVVRVGEESGQK